MGVVLRRTNLENEYYVDMITHNGYPIKDEQDPFAPVDVDKLINSSKFMDVEYRCNCGAFIGSDLIGNICPRCESEIVLRSLNFRYTGWIDIAPHKIIVPVYYQKLRHAITPNMLNYILGNYKADFSVPYNENDSNFEENQKSRKTGRLAANDIVALRKKIPKAKHCYEGIGHDEFYHRFEEIINACCKNEDEARMLIAEKASVFTSKIPIYSTAFRPVSRTSETMFYPQVNKWYSQMVSDQFKLKEAKLDIEFIQFLNSIQLKWMEAVEYTIKNEVSKKEGFVRSEIVGGTFNFSSRGVIILDISLRADEVDLPLHMGITAYKYRLTHIISQRYNMTLEQSLLYVEDYEVHPIVVDCLNEIIEKEDQWIMILREPTNNLGSIMVSRIRRFKPNDSTISLPPEPLPGLNADFDGDQLNQLAIWGESDNIAPLFMPFHLSFMTNYVNENVDIPLMDWSDICLGLMSE